MNERAVLPPGDGGGLRPPRVIGRVSLPLQDVEFALDALLLQKGPLMDVDTRATLASLRDVLGRIAVTARRVEERAETAPESPGHETRAA